MPPRTRTTPRERALAWWKERVDADRYVVPSSESPAPRALPERPRSPPRGPGRPAPRVVTRATRRQRAPSEAVRRVPQHYDGGVPHHDGRLRRRGQRHPTPGGLQPGGTPRHLGRAGVQWGLRPGHRFGAHAPGTDDQRGAHLRLVRGALSAVGGRRDCDGRRAARLALHQRRSRGRLAPRTARARQGPKSDRRAPAFAARAMLIMEPGDYAAAFKGSANMRRGGSSTAHGLEVSLPERASRQTCPHARAMRRTHITEAGQPVASRGPGHRDP